MDPTEVFCFPEVKGIITIIKDTHVGHPRLVYLVGSTLVTLVSPKALSVKDIATFYTVTDHDQAL